MYFLYFLLWVIFNGAITVEICLFGVVIAAVLFAFTCKFMDHSIKAELRLIANVGKMIRYVYVMIKEIILANLAVVHMILSEEEEVQPVIVSFKTKLKKPAARAFLANAITLTPGTITVTLENDQYEVHCLDENFASGMDSSVFVDMLTDMEADQEDK